jgi:hypothetical protein
VRAADPARERPLPLRHDDEVDVVRHQAPGEYTATLTATLVTHMLNIESAVDVVREDVEGPHASLSNVVRQARDHQSWESRHDRILWRIAAYVKKSCGRCPRKT